MGETRLDLGGFDADLPPGELQPRKSNMFLDKPRLPEKNVKVSVNWQITLLQALLSCAWKQ